MSGYNPLDELGQMPMNKMLMPGSSHTALELSVNFVGRAARGKKFEFKPLDTHF